MNEEITSNKCLQGRQISRRLTCFAVVNNEERPKDKLGIAPRLCPFLRSGCCKRNYRIYCPQKVF